MDQYGSKILKTVTGIKRRIADKSSEDWIANPGKRQEWYVEGLRRMQQGAPDDPLPEEAVDSGARSSAGVVFALPLVARARATLPRVPIASAQSAGDGSNGAGTHGAGVASVRLQRSGRPRAHRRS